MFYFTKIIDLYKFFHLNQRKRQYTYMLFNFLSYFKSAVSTRGAVLTRIQCINVYNYQNNYLLCRTKLDVLL